MKKVLSILLSVLMVITTIQAIPFSAYANGAEPVGPNDSEHAYLNIIVNDERNNLYFRGEFNDKGEIEGVSYSLEENTLTLDNYNELEAIIDASEMGSDFKINIIGENHIKAISAFADKYFNSVIICGEGSLILNENFDSEQTPIYLNANYSNSVLEVADSVKLDVFANDVDGSVVVENSSVEEPIICNKSRGFVGCSSCTTVSTKMVSAFETRDNTFFEIKDSDLYTTAIFDEGSEEVRYCEYEIIKNTVDEKEVAFARMLMDDMGNPIYVSQDRINFSNSIKACQLTYATKKPLYHKENDETEYTIDEYTNEGEDTVYWNVFKVISFDNLEKIFYPVEKGLTQEPVEYEEALEKIVITQEYIIGSFSNYDVKVDCNGEHKWDKGVVDVPASCSKPGTKTYSCLVCGDTKTEPIAKKAHSYKTYTTKATTSKNGSVVTKCTVCGVVKSKSTINYAKTVSLSATSYTYDGNYKKPTVTVKDSKGNKISSANYTVTYSNNKSVGKASAKVTFKGKYSGTKTLYFTINPKSTSIASLSARSKGFYVKWNKQATQTTGYQIQYSTSSKFTNPKTVTISKSSTTSKTISKLSGKKKYYVRVRTYKVVNGIKYYSGWSKAKYVTTK